MKLVPYLQVNNDVKKPTAFFRYEKHKTVFILFQILTIAAFSGLYFIPDDPKLADVRLSCGDGETFFSICPKTSSLSISRTVEKIVAINATTECTVSF